MFVSGSIYDPSLLTILLLSATAFSYRNFSRTAKSSFLLRTLRSVVGTACQFSFSLFHLLAVSAESPNRKCKEGKKKAGEDEKEQKDYGCLKLICVRFKRAAGALSIETTVNVVLTLFLNFFAS